jgi:hypothetical protein
MSRPRKERPEGTLKVTVELSPEALATIDRVQSTARALRLPVGSRSDAVNAALSGFDRRYNASIKKAFAEAGDLLSEADHAAAEALPS